MANIEGKLEEANHQTHHISCHTQSYGPITASTYVKEKPFKGHQSPVQALFILGICPI